MSGQLSLLMPYLACSNEAIRSAIVHVLGCVVAQVFSTQVCVWDCVRLFLFFCCAFGGPGALHPGVCVCINVNCVWMLWHCTCVLLLATCTLTGGVQERGLRHTHTHTHTHGHTYKSISHMHAPQDEPSERSQSVRVTTKEHCLLELRQRLTDSSARVRWVRSRRGSTCARSLGCSDLRAGLAMEACWNTCNDQPPCEQAVHAPPCCPAQVEHSLLTNPTQTHAGCKRSRRGGCWWRPTRCPSPPGRGC